MVGKSKNRRGASGVFKMSCAPSIFKSRNVNRLIPVKLTEIVTFLPIGEWAMLLILIPTGEPTSGPHCFRAKYLRIFFMEKICKK
jgi:hypothetical protein